MNKKVEKDLRQKIINEIKRIALENNLDTVSQRIFRQNSNISTCHIYRQFEIWTEAIELADLKPDTSRKKKTDDELWEELLRVCIKLNEIPGRLKFERNSKFNSRTYTKKMGNWEKVLINFKEWLN